MRVSRELISRLVVKLPIILIATLRRNDDKTFAMRDYAMRARVSLGERKRELHRTEVALTLVKRISPSRPLDRSGESTWRDDKGRRGMRAIVRGVREGRSEV